MKGLKKYFKNVYWKPRTCLFQKTSPPSKISKEQAIQEELCRAEHLCHEGNNKLQI